MGDARGQLAYRLHLLGLPQLLLQALPVANIAENAKHHAAMLS